MDKTRQEILQQLLEWQEQGKIGTKYTWVENGKTLTSVSVGSRIRKGLICAIYPLRSVICTPDILEEIQALVDAERVMDSGGAKRKFNVSTDHAIFKLCATGKMLKSEMFGTRTGIYID